MLEAPALSPHNSPAEPTRALRRMSWVMLAVWFAGTMLLSWLMLVYPNQSQKAPYKDVAIEPELGGVEALAHQLHEQGFINNPRAFAAYLRLLDAERSLRKGSVVVNKALSVRALLPRLAEGFGLATVRVPIPEGYTRFDVAQRMSRYGVCDELSFSRAATDGALLRALALPGESAEGYLFPATYELPQGAKAQDVVREMVRVFRSRTAARFKAYESEHDGTPFSLTTHELVTLASIVEREARLPEERPTIAGVFMNRLTSPDFHPKRLQADPTVAYGCLVEPDRIPSCADYAGRVTPAMVRDPANRYSTYRNEGLPPGPISNPGLSALDAALHPQQHDFFYFVTSGGGHHAFTHSLDEHNVRVRGEP